jgi:hypothetical protein
MESPELMRHDERLVALRSRRLVPTNALVVIYRPTPRFVANAEAITDGQNRSPQFGDSTADSIKTPGWDIGSTQDQPGEAQENMPPPVRH